MILSSFLLFLSVFVFNVFCQSAVPVGEALLTAMNSVPSGPLGRADDSNSTDPGLPDAARQKQIREQYFQDKRYRDQLEKEDLLKTNPKLALLPVTPVAAVPTIPVVPMRQMPLATGYQQPAQQYAMPAQYERYGGQPVAAAVPVQAQSNQISPTSLLTSGLLKTMLAPPAMVSDPQQAASQLIPQLITPSLQQGLNQQNPQLAERQLGLNNNMGLGGNLGGLQQQPYGNTGIPGFGSAMPNLGNNNYGMYPQSNGMMQPQMGNLMPNQYTRGFDGNGMNTGYNPNMYGNTGYPATGMTNFAG